MLFAKVVLGLPVEGPFDYIVPAILDKKISAGVRVYVPFRSKKMLGYVVKLTHKTNIKNLKKIQELIDENPVLEKNMLLLTKQVSKYYCCSWGQAIETALPPALRKGKKIPGIKNSTTTKIKGNPQRLLIHDLDGTRRWGMYLEQIKEMLKDNKQVLILLPNINSVLNAKNLIESSLDASLAILNRKEPKEFEEWIKTREGKTNIVIGSRSSIFAPLGNLGLIIIDEEQDSVYKQDQVPHYNAREVAFMRSGYERAKLILGSMTPSLESFYLAKKNKIKYRLISRTEDFPEIKIIDTKSERYSRNQKQIILSKYLEDAIASCFNSGGKVLLFLNRKGFATFASCLACGIVLKCPRCNINLVYHFKENELNCHYCNFKMESPKICPTCNSGYIKFSGTGAEKIESELSRIFVQARIKRLETQEKLDINNADIFVATSSIINKTNYNFDLIGVLGIDNSLNRIDLRSTEKTFALLIGLLGLTKDKIVIQTANPKHNCFQALLKKDINMFYEEELKTRKQLNFPPYRHMILVKLRAKFEDRVRKVSFSLFERLKESNKNKDIRIISVSPGQPSKLRGNYYWQLLITSTSAEKASTFLKIHLKSFRSSGIIVTVDLDPL